MQLTTQGDRAKIPPEYRHCGGYSEVGPPVLIPNTEVKHLCADDTRGATLRGK